MDVPADMNAHTIHAAKYAVLAHIEPIPGDKVLERAIRGQYKTYRTEVANQSSTTETFASITLYSDHPDWRGVPMQLTTGKALHEKRTSITIDFDDRQANSLQFRVQPNEGITLGLRVKKPGHEKSNESTSLDFSYQNTFKNLPADAYERVLVEALRGDHTLFATDKEVLLAWKILQPLLNEWGKNSKDLRVYENGSPGPRL
jgi:glucose-6-phosphate 1-dehydrogenase